MERFGLIGYPLDHSYSKAYFDEKFASEKITDASYELFPLEHLDHLPGLISSTHGIKGLNVTIPHKKKVMSYLDAIDPLASEAGAVNCIRIDRDGGEVKLTGFNTDVYGFMQSLTPLLTDQVRQALIFGSGGSSGAVRFALATLGIDFYVVSRSPGRGDLVYHDLAPEMIHESQLLINTTPCGMYPDVSSSPEIPYDAISSNHILFDLVYNPEQTAFLKKGQAQGARIQNGLKMLHKQAEKSWEIWNEH